MEGTTVTRSFTFVTTGGEFLSERTTICGVASLAVIGAFLPPRSIDKRLAPTLILAMFDVTCATTLSDETVNVVLVSSTLMTFFLNKIGLRTFEPVAAICTTESPFDT
jgi:hypothetical protein